MLHIVRYSLIIFLLFFLGLIFSIVFLFRPFHPYNSYLFARALRPIAFRILGIKIEYRNYNQIKKGGPCIYIGNHQHNVDLLLFGCTLPKGTISLVKKSLAYVPFFGWSYWLAGHFFINRNKHLAALDTMNEIKSAIAKWKYSMLILPEGTRSRGRGLGPFKKGAFRLAVSTQLHIQPIAVCSLDKSINFNKFRAGTVIMEALPPIPVQGLTLKDVDHLMEKARDELSLAIKRLDLEIEKLKTPLLA